GTRGPLLLVLEDLHWADEMSLRLLSFIAHRIDGERVLVLGTMRDDGLADNPALRRLLDALDRDSRHHRIAMSPLSQDDTVALARALSRGRAVSTRVEQGVCDMSEGNPFVVMEIMRELREGGLPPDVVGPSLPTRVREMIASRIERLDPLP